MCSQYCSSFNICRVFFCPIAYESFLCRIADGVKGHGAQLDQFPPFSNERKTARPEYYEDKEADVKRFEKKLRKYLNNVPIGKFDFSSTQHQHALIQKFMGVTLNVKMGWANRGSIVQRANIKPEKAAGGRLKLVVVHMQHENSIEWMKAFDHKSGEHNRLTSRCQENCEGC